MGRQPVTVGGRADAAEYRDELLDRLGLRPDASDQDIDSAHDELVEFLEAAPREMQSWAATRATEVDEAYALLSGPEEDLIPPAVSLAKGGPAEAVQHSPGTSQPVATARVAPAVARPATGRLPRKNVIQALVAVVAIAVVFGVWKMGSASDVPGISGTPTNGSSATPTGGTTPAPVDQTKVLALMKKITANPKDVASLQGLGDIYFASADYKNASVWEQKILTVDPKNEVALVSLGAAQFNASKPAEAKKTWLRGAKLFPKNPEIHYDLGFLYLSEQPPNKAKMTAEWKKFVALDPTSDKAKTVAQHLGSPAPSSSASSTPSTK